MSYFPSVAFLTGSVGSGEWIVLFVVILIVVGPRRMPDVARKLGRMMEMFRRAADEFKDQLMTMDQETSTPSPEVNRVSTPTDVDGVPSSTVAETASTAPYDDAYPNLAPYPGSEAQASNGGGSDALSDVPAAAPEQPVASEPKQPAEGGS